MRVHFLQHVPFEGLGSIEPWLLAAGHQVTGTRLYDNPALPELSEFEMLIVMGGPMSIHDEAEFPWLVQEKKLIRDAIDAGKSVLGICLGSQLIASAMGAQVYKNASKEIGWFPIQGIPVEDYSLFSFPASIDVFHWHGETFDLPSGAVHLASSSACQNQAFQLGKSVIGLQFHLETTPDSAVALVSHCRHELLPSSYVQSEAEILAAPPQRYESINDLMGSVLVFLTAQ